MEWISVDDKLPKGVGWYMVKIKYGSMSPKIKERKVMFKSTGSPRFVVGDWETVTHWQEINLKEKL